MSSVTAEEFAGWLERNRHVGNRIRTARVASADAAAVSAYLYSNYQVTDVSHAGADGYIIIEGIDVAGFTLDAIIERLTSGLIGARDVAVLWPGYP